VRRRDFIRLPGGAAAGTSKPFAPQLAPAALKLSRANFMARTIFRSHSTTSNQWVRKLQYS